jgi:hypothetical protein
MHDRPLETTELTVAADPSLSDEFLEGYISWREECLAVQGAYEAWQDADPGGRAGAFAAYRAALDREEQASLIFRASASQVAVAA